MRSAQRIGGCVGGSHFVKHRSLRRAVIEGLERRQLMSVNVLTWHNDAGRTGLNSSEQILTPSNVNSGSFGELFSYPVQGQVYAQPLYVSNLAIPGKGTRNVVFVVTMNNDVYAFDANSNAGVGAGVLWHVNLGPAAPVPNPFIGNRYGPDHDTTPLVGITSTPVIDLASKTMYIDAFTNDVAGQDAFSHHIHALDITTGADKVTPMLVAAAVAGNGVGGNGSTVTFAADRQLQRPALTLFNGVLYAEYSAFADTNPYHGWVLGFNASSLQLLSVLNTTPNLDTDANQGEGGIWQSGNGLASDGVRTYVETGNGDYNPAVGDYSDSILAITPDTSTQGSPHLTGYGLNVSDYFTPYNEQALADADADLGSSGPLVLPDQPGAHVHELIGSGKEGKIYLVDRDNMGHHNTAATGNDNNIIQTVPMGHGVFGSPAYFNSAIYYHAVGDVMKRYTLSNGLLSAAPASQSAITYTSQGGTPSISANGTANGIAWDVQWDATHQVLHAYDATTLAELYNSNQNTARDQMGAGVKFITPTIADGEVFVGSSNALTIYGELAPVTTPPAAPSNLLASATGASSVSLSWVDNSDNESGFKIERSTDNSNYSQIGIVGVSVTSYVDNTAAPSTLYYYRVRATNVIGDSAYTAPATATTPAATGATDVYHFDAGSGTSAIDSGSGNNGTLTGSPLPLWVAGKIGTGALSFSGDGTYNQAASQSAVKVTTNLSTILGSTSTLDVWVKTTQTGSALHSNAPAITGVEQAGGANDINWGTLDATGRIGLYVGDSGGVYSNNRINDGQWHNVGMTRNASTGLVQIFIDGVLNSSATLDTGNKTSSFSLIGALSDVAADGVTRTGDNYFNGQLDEVRIYNQAIGLTEIDGLALIPAAPTLSAATVNTGPVVHLTFSSPSSYAQNIEIDRKTGVNGTFAAIATVAGSASLYDDTNVAAGTSYYYQLKAIDLAGVSPASNILSVTPPVPTVIANHIFYNRSSFDGQNGSSNLTDTNAIATDKIALLPGGTASFQNYTSYSRGINGIIIDVANMVNLPRVDDFSFFVGNDNNPSGWATAPTPALVNAYPGRGPGGSTQITVIWDDNVIQNEWLQVTMLAQPHLGLLSDDVFYFGNAIGETGDSASDAIVTSNDAARVNANPAASAPVTNIYDINRDGVVDGTDAGLVNANTTTAATALKLISFAGNAPTIAAPAAATPATVTGTTSALSVLGAYSGGESGLTYTWTTTGTPPAAVVFSANGTNAAKNTTVSFAMAGNYSFLVTITNSSNFSVTSAVNVVVSQTVTSVTVTPPALTLAANTTTQFSASARDQFGNAMAVQPSFSWSVFSGGGSVDASGLYTAGRTAGSATVRAAASTGPIGSAGITIFYDVLAWYQADAASGTTLADSSGDNLTGTLNGAAAFGGGVSGNALTLTGGYAALPLGIVGSLNDFTISAWVKVTSLANWARIFDFGSSTTANMFLTPDAGGTNSLRFAITNSGNGNEQRVDGPAMPLNTWTHIAITLAGNTATMYINGVAYASNTAVTLHPTNLGATTQNYLGKSQYADPALQGSIDDFRIYTRALSPLQVLQLAAPAVAAPAAASAAPVTTTSTTLSVLGSDITAGEAALTYTWVTTGSPPAPVTFGTNGNNAAKNITATFTKIGTYNFQVTITNPGGLSTISTTSVVVSQGAVSLSVTPSSASLSDGQTKSFSATGVDQFGNAIASPSVIWSVDSGGVGSVDAAGVYSAPSSGPGSATVRATSGSATNTASVNVILSVIAGTSGNDAIRLVRNGANLVVYINNAATPAYTVPFASIGALAVNTSTGSDSVNVDFSGGASPVPSSGLTVDEDVSAGDFLIITGTTSGDSASVNASAITFNGSGISYANVEAIVINGNGGADALTQAAQPGGGATLAFNGGIGGGTSSSDSLTVNGGTYTFALLAGGSGIVSLPLSSLSIGANASVVIGSAASHADRYVAVLGQLNLAGSTNAWTAKLDLGGNDLIVKGGSVVTLSNQLKQGFNLAASGFWNGAAGIISSTAAANASHLTTLAVLLNNDGASHAIYGTGTTYGLFDGQNPALADVLLKYTYFGDADLSGHVDGTDYSKIDNGFNNHLTGWFNGDFNYDGVIDGSDYSLIDNAFNTQGTTLSNSATASATASSMTANVTAILASTSRCQATLLGGSPNQTGRTANQLAPASMPFSDTAIDPQDSRHIRLARIRHRSTLPDALAAKTE